jgi:hypothetical protein
MVLTRAMKKSSLSTTATPSAASAASAASNASNIKSTAKQTPYTGSSKREARRLAKARLQQATKDDERARTRGSGALQAEGGDPKAAAVGSTSTPAQPANVKLSISRTPVVRDLKQACRAYFECCSLAELSEPHLSNRLLAMLEARFEVDSLKPHFYRVKRLYARQIVKSLGLLKPYASSTEPGDNLIAARLYRELLSLNLDRAGSAGDGERDGDCDGDCDGDGEKEKTEVGPLSNGRLIELVVQEGVLPQMVKFLSPDYDAFGQLQHEAAWLLTNVAYGTVSQTAAVVSAGAVPALAALFARADDVQLKEQALWCLANIAGDSQYRAEVMASGILRHLQECVMAQLYMSEEMAKCVGWFLCNMARLRLKDGPLDAEAVWSLSTMLGRMAFLTTNEEALKDITWSLKSLSEVNGDLNLRALMHNPEGMCRMELVYRIGDLMTHPSPTIRQNVAGLLRGTMTELLSDPHLFTAAFCHAGSLFDQAYQQHAKDQLIAEAEAGQEAKDADDEL